MKPSEYLLPVKDNRLTNSKIILDQSESIEKAYFSIGEVAEKLKVSTSLIRFWETEFDQIKPRKTKGGTRKYSIEDLNLLKIIYQLVKIEGYTLPGAREMLKLKTDKLNMNTEITEKLLGIKTFLIQLKDELG